MFSSLVSVEPQYGQRNAFDCSCTSDGPDAARGAGGAKPDSEVDERDDRDFGIRDLRERLPDLLPRHHVVPGGWERRTIVISFHRSASSGPWLPRASSRGRNSSSAFV